MAVVLLGIIDAYPTPGRELYLFAATPHESWPARIYQIGTNKKLALVREVALKNEGVECVLEGGAYISTLSPASRPNRINIIEKSSPGEVHSWALPPAEAPIVGPLLRLAVVGSQYFQLLPYMSLDGRVPDARPEIDLQEAALTAADFAVHRSPADRLRSIYVDGTEGGPSLVYSIIGDVRPDGLYLNFGTLKARIDSVPPELVTKGASRFVLTAATPQFLVVVPVNWDPQHWFDEPKSTIYYVHNRALNRWSSFSVAGNEPKERLLTPWLITSAMSVGLDKPDNPGRGLERGYRTAELPNVQLEFETGIGANRYISGQLTMTNLSDSRHNTLNTGVEDSEVLGVDNTAVVYRINNAIYEAMIQGEKVGIPTLLVQDQDVPEIHWMFWGNRKY